MVTFVRWQVKLWLVRFDERLANRELRLARNQFGIFSSEKGSRFERFVNWISPWAQGPFGRNNGYRRVLVRRWLYRLRYPRTILNAHLTWAFHAVMRRFIPYTGPGKFERNDKETRLKVEWLYARPEYADQQAGDLTEYPLYELLFLDLPMPWSRKPESWILEVDEMGFVIGLPFENVTEAKISFGGFEYRYEKTLSEWEIENTPEVEA